MHVRSVKFKYARTMRIELQGGAAARSRRVNEMKVYLRNDWTST
jgi:hypothetical protein